MWRVSRPSGRSSSFLTTDDSDPFKETVSRSFARLLSEMRRMKNRNLLLGGVALAVSVGLSSTTLAAGGWPSGGYDLDNSRFQDKESKISVSTASGLKLVWSVNTNGDVTANPAVDETSVYFPDSAGFLYRVNKKTGAI